MIASVMLGASAAAAASSPAAAGRSAADVIILANASDPDSVRVARHYADVRGVPAANLIALPMPTAETVIWREFVPALWAPLLARLVQEHWIDAIPMEATDDVGRRKYAVQGHRIAALVVCRGVPLRISHDPDLAADNPSTRHPELRSNAGAVDSELALLAQPTYPITGLIPNPLFGIEHPTLVQRQQVVLVSRLDGPTADDALALVDHAVIAERDGLLGRAYVDLTERTPAGNAWLEAAARTAEALGFDTAVDRAPATLPATARIDAPALYFGWYAPDLDGPFALPGFRFPPGAVAVHIHSYSATTLRSATQGWAGPLVARGVTATVGNVHEPYLELTHRPDLLLQALARGATLAEAAFEALPGLSWQAVLIGDPLYRPFPAGTRNPSGDGSGASPLHAYAVVQAANRLRRSGHPAEALALLRRAQRAAPSLVVGLALAAQLPDTDPRAAAEAIEAAPMREPLAPDTWAEVREAAQRLTACGRPAAALVRWRALLADRALPAALRVAWLPEAAEAAEAARDPAQAAVWQKEHARLLATPTGPMH